jgi:hypothetical protein
MRKATLNSNVPAEGSIRTPRPFDLFLLVRKMASGKFLAED